MVLKLDLGKAYDRMEWPFVEKTLIDAGFPMSLVGVIMNILKASPAVDCGMGRSRRALDHPEPSGMGIPYLHTSLYFVWSARAIGSIVGLKVGHGGHCELPLVESEHHTCSSQMTCSCLLKLERIKLTVSKISCPNFVMLQADDEL